MVSGIILLAAIHVSLFSALALTPPVTTITFTNQSNSTYQFQIFDPVAQINRARTDNADSGYLFDSPLNSGGILAYQETESGTLFHSTKVNLAIWMPDSDWNTKEVSKSLQRTFQYVDLMQNRDGVVCWEETGEFSNGLFDRAIHTATFHPLIGWNVERHLLDYEGAGSAALTTANGVVAWRDFTSNFLGNRTTIYYSVYDPFARVWRTGSWFVDGGSVSNPSIVNGEVRWTNGATAYTRTYNAATGWQSGGVPVTRAFFVPSKTKGTAPVIWFIDMSLFANPVRWNFGDSPTILEQRSPYHSYAGCNVFSATQLAFNAGVQSDSYGVTIVTDATLPTGTVSINGGAATTTNSSVTLSLTVADNCGVSGMSMRFSNDGASWSNYEAFASTKSWTLTAGEGSRTVSVQFLDRFGNSSQTYNDSIVVVTTPLTILDIVDVSPDPRSSAVPTVDVVFSKAIDISSFTYLDVLLSRSGMNIVPTSALTASLVSGTTYRLSGLQTFTAGFGTYTLTVNAGGIKDQLGIFGSGVASDSWTTVSPDGIIYVNTAYSGPYPAGTLADPFRTVNDGNNSAQNGNTIRIYGGGNSYPETLIFNKVLRVESTNGTAIIGK